MTYSRYAIYFLPPGALADFGAAWLGWDVATGLAVKPPDVPGLSADDIRRITGTPRKYGLHGTLKAPFRPVPGTSEAHLIQTLDDLALTLSPVPLPGLRLATIGRFLALVPDNEDGSIQGIDQSCVQAFEPFRSPPPEAELARRRAGGLSPRQDRNLQTWGYPFVFEDFRFHITLTGKLEADEAAQVRNGLQQVLPDLPRPYVLDRISLVGETPEGFRLLHHAALSG